MPHRVVGEAAFFQRAEVRDLLAWLRLLADPGDAPAVVRALARAPIELRSIDIARCTQIARRRKLDMVAALAAATESPQVPPEARERIRVFLKLYRACVAQIDTMRPDLYVHRLIERLGLRRQQLFAAQADVVERLRALARFGELAVGSRRAHAAGDGARVRTLDRGGRRVGAERARGAGARGRRRRAGARPGRGRRARGRPRLRARAAGVAAGLGRARLRAGPGRAAARAAARRRRRHPPLASAPAAVRGDLTSARAGRAGLRGRWRARRAVGAAAGDRGGARRRSAGVAGR